MTKLESIQQYIKDLPLKDQSIAKIFIDKRQFEDLMDLIKSAIIKTNRYYQRMTKDLSKSPEMNYEKTSLEGMENMKYELQLYLDLING